jgi:hypothetical protein
MSDRPLAEDWWLASDGKWYPPQSMTGQPPPPTGEVSSSIGRRYVPFGLTGTLMGFFITAAVLYGVGAVLYLGTWGLWRDFDSGGSTTFSDVLDLASAGDGMVGFGLITALVIAVLIIIWCNLSYKAASSRGASGQAWSSGWAVGGWFIPLANLAIPKLVINEIDRMSNEQLIEPITGSWHDAKRTAISDWWWVFFVAGAIASAVGDAMSAENIDFLWASAVGYGIWSVGAVLGGITVLKVGKRLRA